MPIDRRAGIGRQLVGSEVRWLAAMEDRLGYADLGGTAKTVMQIA